jgi:hypothetical protein
MEDMGFELTGDMALLPLPNNTKIKGAYWIIQRFLVHYQILNLSQYWTFLYCSLFIYHSPKSYRSYSLLKAIAKSKGKIIALSCS